MKILIFWSKRPCAGNVRVYAWRDADDECEKIAYYTAGRTSWKLKSEFKKEELHLNQFTGEKMVQLFLWNWVYASLRFEGRKFHQGIIRDITERKRSGGNIKESEEKFRTLADQSPNMIFIAYKRQRFVYVMKMRKTYGIFKRGVFILPISNFLKIIAPEHVEFIIEKYHRHINGEESAIWSYCFGKRREKIDTINTTKLIPYESGKQFLSIMTDISERKKNRGSASKIPARYRAFTGCCFHNRCIRCYCFYKSAFERMYGYNFRKQSEKHPEYLIRQATKEEYEGFWKLFFPNRWCPVKW